jgi:hypothetical protein
MQPGNPQGCETAGSDAWQGRHNRTSGRHQDVRRSPAASVSPVGFVWWRAPLWTRCGGSVRAYAPAVARDAEQVTSLAAEWNAT